MKTHHCDCGWKGYFPAYIRTEKKDGVATITKDIPVCKKCKEEIKLKDIR